MLKRKKHQQWSWTKSTNLAVDRYIKWSSKPQVQKDIFSEHIEIPLRNHINDFVSKKVGSQSYLKTQYLVDGFSIQFKENVIPELENQIRSKYLSTTLRYMKKYLRDELKKVWTDSTNLAVKRYIKWEHQPSTTKKIFRDHIEEPLMNLSRRNVKTQMFFGKGEKLIQYDPFKESSYDKEIDNLVNECVSYFFTTLLPYIKNGTINNIFGYVNSSIKHNLILMNTQRSTGTFNWEPLYGYGKDDSLMHRSGMELPKIKGSDLSIDEVHYVNLLLNYWDKNIENIWKKGNQEFQRTVARNVIDLMRRSNRIKHFKVDSMRRYLRKMMGWDKGESVYSKKGMKGGGKRNAFNKVLRKMRDRNKLLRLQYKSKGMIDFYYI